MQKNQENLATKTLDKQEWKNEIYSTLEKVLKQNRDQVTEFLLDSDDSFIVHFLRQKQIDDKNIESALKLKTYDLLSRNGLLSYDLLSRNDLLSGEYRSTFHTMSAGDMQSSRYFKPIGDETTTSNGQVNTDDNSMCSNNCDGAIVGQFLTTNKQSGLTYKFNNDRLEYSIATIDQYSLTKVISNNINLPGFNANTLKVEAIDINGDGFDDLIASSADINDSITPKIILNDGNNYFSEVIEINKCSSTKVISGNFFGPQNKGIWCKDGNGLNKFYKITYNKATPLASAGIVISLEMAKSNWCNNGQGIAIDFNGDKYSDVLCLNNNVQQLLLSVQGNHLKQVNANYGSINLFNVDNINTQKFAVGDFDGNGKEDIVRNDNEGNHYFYLSNGKSFFGYQPNQASTYSLSIGNNNFCKTGFYASGYFNSNDKASLWCADSFADFVMHSRLESDTIIPKVKISLSYKDFNVIVPNDLSPYNTTMVSSSRFVNAKDQGNADFTSELSLNIPLYNSMDSFYKDIRSSKNILEGKVIFLKEYDNNILPSNISFSGYKIQTAKSDLIEIDWFSSQRVLNTNILSQWDEINLRGDVRFSLNSNNCLNPQIVAYLYKDVPIKYTASGYISMKDTNNNPLLGNDLLNAAHDIFNKPVQLLSQSEAVFATEGVFKHSALHNVETVLKECNVQSVEQIPSKLSKAVVSLSYIYLSRSLPQNLDDYKKTISTSVKLQNSKKYGSTDMVTPLKIEVQATNSLRSADEDKKPNELVIDGRICHYKNYDDIQSSFGENFNGYKVNTENKDSVCYSWFNSPGEVSSEILSNWKLIRFEAEEKVTLVPQQCIKLKMTAVIYQDVQVAYQAKGVLTAKDENGYQIINDKLLLLCTSVVNKEVELNSKGECEFAVDGKETITLSGETVVESLDC